MFVSPPATESQATGLEPDAAGLADPIEAALAALLLAHADAAQPDAAAMAGLVAARALLPNHLWEDMGLANRAELNALLRRCFPTLHALNVRDMKWKRFFYRQLCEADGLALCASPNCEQCADWDLCFGPEA
jgi:nitrogen fixation protein NifQ